MSEVHGSARPSGRRRQAAAVAGALLVIGLIGLNGCTDAEKPETEVADVVSSWAATAGADSCKFYTSGLIQRKWGGVERCVAVRGERPDTYEETQPVTCSNCPPTVIAGKPVYVVTIQSVEFDSSDVEKARSATVTAEDDDGRWQFQLVNDSSLGWRIDDLSSSNDEE